MMIEVTKCPPGYAIGYTPFDGSSEMYEVAKDTRDVRAASRAAGMLIRQPREVFRYENYLFRESLARGFRL